VSAKSYIHRMVDALGITFCRCYLEVILGDNSHVTNSFEKWVCDCSSVRKMKVQPKQGADAWLTYTKPTHYRGLDKNHPHFRPKYPKIPASVLAGYHPSYGCFSVKTDEEAWKSWQKERMARILADHEMDSRRLSNITVICCF
jgi:hypothetical protein